MISNATHLETPLGNLAVNSSVRNHMMTSGLFDLSTQSIDEAEHSIELHLPYVAKLLELSTSHTEENAITVVPIIVGHLSAAMVDSVSAFLLPYFQDPSTLFIISR